MMLGHGLTLQRNGRVVLLLLCLGTAGCGGGAPLPAEDPSRMTIRLTSPAFPEGGRSRSHTLRRRRPVPAAGMVGCSRLGPLAGPALRRSRRAGGNVVALGRLRPGAPGRVAGRGRRPGDTLKLEGDLSARQGKNDFGKIGYGGPCPPRGTHRYIFRLYALDRLLDLAAARLARRSSGASTGISSPRGG